MTYKMYSCVDIRCNCANMHQRQICPHPLNPHRVQGTISSCPKRVQDRVRWVKLVNLCRTWSKRVRHVSGTCPVRHVSDTNTPLIWACPCFRYHHYHHPTTTHARQKKSQKRKKWEREKGRKKREGKHSLSSVFLSPLSSKPPTNLRHSQVHDQTILVFPPVDQLYAMA